MQLFALENSAEFLNGSAYKGVLLFAFLGNYYMAARATCSG
jgi:hypothetical protein